MTNAFGGPLLDSSAIDDDAWNHKTFDRLMNLIGARLANNLAARFKLDLRNRFADMTNRELVRRDAHAVTSTSEVLGLAKLSQAARRLETACETGEAFESSLQRFLMARIDATHALSNYMAPE
jgi:hypothetical protein